MRIFKHVLTQTNSNCWFCFFSSIWIFSKYFMKC